MPNPSSRGTRSLQELPPLCEGAHPAQEGPPPRQEEFLHVGHARSAQRALLSLCRFCSHTCWSATWRARGQGHSKSGPGVRLALVAESTIGQLSAQQCGPRRDSPVAEMHPAAVHRGMSMSPVQQPTSGRTAIHGSRGRGPERCAGHFHASAPLCRPPSAHLIIRNADAIGELDA